MLKHQEYNSITILRDGPLENGRDGGEEQCQRVGCEGEAVLRQRERAPAVDAAHAALLAVNEQVDIVGLLDLGEVALRLLVAVVERLD